VSDVAAQLERVLQVAIRVAHELVIAHAEDGAGSALLLLADGGQALARHGGVVAAFVTFRDDDVGDDAAGLCPLRDCAGAHELCIVGVGDYDHGGGWDKGFDDWFGHGSASGWLFLQTSVANHGRRGDPLIRSGGEGMIRRVRLRSLALATVMLVALFLHAACFGGDGSDKGEEGSTESEPTEAALRDAAQRQSEALFEGDEEMAYAYLSAKCQGEMSLRDYRSELNIARRFFEQFTGAKLADVAVAGVQVREFSNERAEVLVEVTTPPESVMPLGDDEWQAWVYEGGGWRLDTCAEGIFGGG
jgi:hypothetical protein